MVRIEDEMAALKARIEKLTELVGEGQNGAAMNLLKTKAEEAGVKLRKMVDDSGIKDKYHEIHDNLTDKVEDFESKIEDEVQNHPLRTLTFAFLAGVAFSTFFGRRR